MSYCINPDCNQPKNQPQDRVCRSCGSKLILRNRYLTYKVLGKGGFGTTFLAKDLQLPGKPSCVIKQLRPNASEPDMFSMAKELFEREAETLGKIGNHPQIPRLLDYFEDQQRFYLVQEYVQGLNLHQEIKQNGRYSEAGVKQFLSELLPIMQYVHTQQVIHRDIKPANLIRRDPDRKLVLIDFGAVKNQVDFTAGQSPSDTAQSALTAFAVGTAGFAPPEQLAMRPVYASDIYAIGVTCLFLLTGRSPKDLGCDSATGEILWRPHVVVSDHFAKVLQTMLEVSVRHRYKGCKEVLEALDLEPYMDSLAQGLATQPTATRSSPGEETLISPASHSFAAPPTQMMNHSHSGDRKIGSSNGGKNSATSKLAMAIRARRERKRQQAQSQSPMPQNSGDNSVSVGDSHIAKVSNTRPPANSPQKNLQKNTNPPKDVVKKNREKLDTKALLEHYGRGRRDFAQMNLNLLACPSVDLSGIIFHQSRMVQTNFAGTKLTNADFGRAKLNQSIFRRAVLCRAYFGYADLTEADFRGADLQFAHLKNANLQGANLCGANLSNALVSEAQLNVAKTNWSTIFPSGKRSFW
ncbi:MAG: serine/threonine-protein kinase [Cyanobacteria bacterium P01_H01_bin.15]